MSKAWTADAILELARSYQSTCVLAAAAELDLYTVAVSMLTCLVRPPME